ncbi:MFS general substrate transporter [Raphidocelis subcapitata]|uniref:MFS general substrate transporter n=1 Tax=Raphidocelis subcapitata TaxID=307507 RepID=A0A2V0NSL4_9CHLO|nr:MFS general substrate transporter [Raphidocelis subcapitata]|eukprot:GBF89652.1 MFS general substrate transporter [Raphidocelis subcapitata]
MMSPAAFAAARMRTAILVNLAMVVEQANEQVLPAVYLFVGSSLSATPSQLGTLTLCRALVQTLSSPLSGVLGDRCDRRLVLASGAFIWGAMTSAIAASSRLHTAMVFAAFNGLGLALLVPCCQSLVADLHAPEARGRAFGLMQLTGAVGGMAGSVFATNMGAADTLATWGVEGWRLAFHAVAVVSVLTGAAVLAFAIDPRRAAVAAAAAAPIYLSLPGDDDGGGAAPPPLPLSSGEAAGGLAKRQAAEAAGGGGGWGDAAGGPRSRSPSPSAHLLQLHHGQPRHPPHDAAAGCGGSAAAGRDAEEAGAAPPRDCGDDDDSDSGKARRYGRPRPRQRGLVSDILWVLRIPTFQAIVLQGIVGSFPWQAAVFFTLWLQLQGFPSSTSANIAATFGAGVAVGALLGGYIGDRAARRLPDSGRIFTAQASVASGIPLIWLVLKGIPANPALASDPRAYAAVLFVMGATCSWAGSGCNSPIFAEIVPEDMRSLVYAFDRSLETSLAACAAPTVGLLAERVWGFSGAVSRDSLADEVLRARNAGALGSSLLVCMTVPWTACLVFYTVLHFTYRNDRRAALAASR